jgi:hypothetical protein
MDIKPRRIALKVFNLLNLSLGFARDGPQRSRRLRSAYLSCTEVADGGFGLGNPFIALLFLK